MDQKQFNVKSAELDIQYTTQELLFLKIKMEEGIRRAEAQCKIKIAELKFSYEDAKLTHERNKAELELFKSELEKGFE